MTAEVICILAGPVIALLVSSFKRLAIVGDHPKIAAAILAAIQAVIASLSFDSVHLDFVQLAQCFVVPFSVAVASFEVVKSSRHRSSAPDL